MVLLLAGAESGPFVTFCVHQLLPTWVSAEYLPGVPVRPQRLGGKVDDPGLALACWLPRALCAQPSLQDDPSVSSMAVGRLLRTHLYVEPLVETRKLPAK